MIPERFAWLKSDLRGIETLIWAMFTTDTARLKSDLRGIETPATSPMYPVTRLVKIRP